MFTTYLEGHLVYNHLATSVFPIYIVIVQLPSLKCMIIKVIFETLLNI